MNAILQWAGADYAAHFAPHRALEIGSGKGSQRGSALVTAAGLLHWFRCTLWPTFDTRKLASNDWVLPRVFILRTCLLKPSKRMGGSSAFFMNRRRCAYLPKMAQLALSTLDHSTFWELCTKAHRHTRR
jgi:hypothetical protein